MAELTSNSMQLVLLGTGTPNAEPERSGPASAVIINHQAYVVDCGPGVVRRAAAAAQSGIDALAAPRLTRLFVTHLHSDHTSGLPDMMLTPAVLGRTEGMQIYGPKGIKHMVAHIEAAYQEDIRERLEGLEPADPAAYQFEVHEIQSGLIYEDENVTVEAIPVKHGTWPACAFKFSSGKDSIVISGDTAPHPELVERSKGCSILLHEVYCSRTFEKRSVKWQRYHSNLHTSTLELGEIANQIKPGLLVLYHQLLWGAEEEDLLTEIASQYSGKVISANDLDVFNSKDYR